MWWLPPSTADSRKQDAPKGFGPTGSLFSYEKIKKPGNLGLPGVGSVALKKIGGQFRQR